ncbi:MAG: ComF family protein [Pseudomonadota bacterium]
MAALARPLLDLVLPPLCPVTGEETGGHGALSPKAWADLGLLLDGPRCHWCNRALAGAASGPRLACEACHVAERPWTEGAAAFLYEGSGRTLVLALKRGDRLDLAPLLAAWMARARPGLAEAADLIVPVPLHWRRLLSRRYNQSAELARALARHTGNRSALAPRLLRRIRATPSQDGLGPAERQANLAGAIALPKGAEQRLAGRRVLLIDDVLTTGATLTACTHALLDGGAARVDVAVAALVERPAKPYLPGSKDTPTTEEPRA